MTRVECGKLPRPPSSNALVMCFVGALGKRLLIHNGVSNSDDYEATKNYEKIIND